MPKQKPRLPASMSKSSLAGEPLPAQESRKSEGAGGGGRLACLRVVPLTLAPLPEGEGNSSASIARWSRVGRSAAADPWGNRIGHVGRGRERSSDLLASIRSRTAASSRGTAGTDARMGDAASCAWALKLVERGAVVGGR